MTHTQSAPLDGRRKTNQLLLACCALALAAGCGQRSAQQQETRADPSRITAFRPQVPPVESATATESRDANPSSNSWTALLDRLQHVVQRAGSARQLNVRDHGAWQIMHGLLAYQDRFPLLVDPQQPPQSALAYVLDGGPIRGLSWETGELLDPSTGRRGLRATWEPGSRQGQGHPDQWLAILAQCSVQPDQEIRVGSAHFTMADLLQQTMRDVHRNVDQEYSWTLIGLTAYLPTDTQWMAGDGSRWSVERLVELEMDQDLHESACGGSHRLIGLSMALQRHITDGGQLSGIWQQANQQVQQAIELAREYQNPDGSFSTNYFARPGQSPDLALSLGTTGHTLEFLALALNDKQLQAPWVRHAVENLCTLLEETEDLPLECGALYHAMHGLVVYRKRVTAARGAAGKTGER